MSTPPRGQLDRPASPDAVDPLVTDDALGPEALIEEARRPRRRRRARVAIAILAVAALVTGLVLLFGSSTGSTQTHTAAGPGESVSVQSLHFPGPFVPAQVTSLSGKIWFLGSSGTGTGAGCVLESVDPDTLRTRSFPLPACGGYLAVGGGRIFVLADIPVLDRSQDQLHLEVFDPSTHRATVMNPVALTTLGSERAHLAMAYDRGSVWLYGGKTTVLELSTATGAVVGTLSGIPVGGSGHPSLVGNRAGLWFTSGDSTGQRGGVDRAAPGADGFSRVYSGPTDGVIPWLATMGTGVWAEVLSQSNPTSGSSKTPVQVTRFIGLASSGEVTVQTPPEHLGGMSLVAAAGQLWLDGPRSYRCSNPQRLWHVDPRTGTVRPVVRLKSPSAACLEEGFGTGGPGSAKLGAIGNDVFVLDSTPPTSAVLYRVRLGR